MTRKCNPIADGRLPKREAERKSLSELLSLIPTIADMLEDVPDYIFEECRYSYGTYAMNAVRDFLFEDEGWTVSFPYEVKYVVVNEEETRDCPGSLDIEATEIRILNPVQAWYDDEVTVELEEREIDMFAEELQRHLP